MIHILIYEMYLYISSIKISNQNYEFLFVYFKENNETEIAKKLKSSSDQG